MMRSAAASVVLGAAIAALSATSGCQAPGLILQGVLPPPKIQPVFTPINQTTAVFLDDPQGRVPTLQLLDLIAARVGNELKEHLTISEFIPPGLVTEARLNEKDFGSWAIDRVGKRVGAKQVIYVAVEAFDLGQIGSSAKPTASVRVKVVDVASGRRLFPEQDPTGYPLTSAMFYKTLDDTNRASGQMLERKLADRLAGDIAKMFYEHEPRAVGSDFPE